MRRFGLSILTVLFPALNVGTAMLHSYLTCAVEQSADSYLR